MVIGSYNHSREGGRELRKRDHKEGGEPNRSEEDNHRLQLSHALCECSATTSQGSSLDLKYCISLDICCSFLHSANIYWVTSLGQVHF